MTPEYREVVVAFFRWAYFTPNPAWERLVAALEIEFRNGTKYDPDFPWGDELDPWGWVERGPDDQVWSWEAIDPEDESQGYVEVPDPVITAEYSAVKSACFDWAAADPTAEFNHLSKELEAILALTSDLKKGDRL